MADRKLRDELKASGWTDADVDALPKWCRDALVADDDDAASAKDGNR